MPAIVIDVHYDRSESCRLRPRRDSGILDTEWQGGRIRTARPTASHICTCIRALLTGGGPLRGHGSSSAEGYCARPLGLDRPRPYPGLGLIFARRGHSAHMASDAPPRVSELGSIVGPPFGVQPLAFKGMASNCLSLHPEDGLLLLYWRTKFGGTIVTSPISQFRVSRLPRVLLHSRATNRSLSKRSHGSG